jgi:hypothetical protein
LYFTVLFALFHIFCSFQCFDFNRFPLLKYLNKLLELNSTACREFIRNFVPYRVLCAKDIHCSSIQLGIYLQLTYFCNINFEVFAVVNALIVGFWVSNTVQSCRRTKSFWEEFCLHIKVRKTLTMMMRAVYSPKIMIPTSKNTRYHNPGDHDLKIYPAIIPRYSSRQLLGRKSATYVVPRKILHIYFSRISYMPNYFPG